MNIFVVNAGSSSLKYQLIDMNSRTILSKGCCERIGLDGKFTCSTYDGRKQTVETNIPDHYTAFKLILSMLLGGNCTVVQSVDDIHAIGHRIVNGGEKFSSSVLVNDQVLKEFEEVVELAPLHNPPAFALLKLCLEILGSEKPNVLVFDTTFHQTMPPKAFLFGVPYRYYEQYKLRRYGAHGTSHHYVSLKCNEMLGKDPTELKIVTCHLGNGSSISAVNQGKCVDTSMGFTPLGGIIMGTRCGDLDPSVVTFIMKKDNLSAADVENLLNRQSGILGSSGISSDLREIQNAAGEGNKQATVSFEMLVYQIKKYIGAYAAAMNGLDALVFTAGIGENSSILREAVCSNMDYLGISIDGDKNKTTVLGREGEISDRFARVKTLVIPTNEEYMIAFETKAIVEMQLLKIINNAQTLVMERT